MAEREKKSGLIERVYMPNRERISTTIDFIFIEGMLLATGSFLVYDKFQEGEIGLGLVYSLGVATVMELAKELGIKSYRNAYYNA
jgi:hypothetical protein